MKGRLAMQYIFGEMLPSYLMGMIIFVLLLLMFQAVRLTEFVLVHGVKFDTVLQIAGYMTVSFLPAIFPMSLLFAVLLTYSRLNNDFETMALKAVGLHLGFIGAPGLVLALATAVLSAHTSFSLAPWGNRQFELLITKIGNQKTGINLREGTFSEGFFNLVVYANSVDSKSGKLGQVFIYDESDPANPLTIVAQRGEIMQEPGELNYSALLRLTSGDIHRQSSSHTKIRFATYDIKLASPMASGFRQKSPPSLTRQELEEKLTEPLDPADFRILSAELHKRWAGAAVCIIFAFLGIGLGCGTGARSAKSGSTVIALGIIVVYWLLYVASENIARSGYVPAPLAIWAPNFLFSSAAIWALRRAW